MLHFRAVIVFIKKSMRQLSKKKKQTLKNILTKSLEARKISRQTQKKCHPPIDCLRKFPRDLLFRFPCMHTEFNIFNL